MTPPVGNNSSRSTRHQGQVRWAMRHGRNRTAQLRIEFLEQRNLLAIASVFAGGILTIGSADAVNDTVTIDDVAAAFGTIDVNGVDVAGATFAATTRIIFTNTGTGADNVAIDPANNDAGFDSIPVEMIAGTAGANFNASSVATATVRLEGGAGDGHARRGGRC